MRSSLTDLLATRDVLLADGATGTNYFQRGLTSGHAPELWNVEHPEHVQGLHREFVEAGADIILTNSFGGTAQRLKLHHAQDRVFELNELAAKLAREVADASDRPVVVAGS
ncbi:MAG TPA: homocysteine S-methyltransferase family protein, partial [Ottowia sp.]|nr:homocysteine S-methyltransferase family protein [Ottowia sp.]